MPVSYTKYVTKHMSKIEMGEIHTCKCIVTIYAVGYGPDFLGKTLISRSRGYWLIIYLLD